MSEYKVVKGAHAINGIIYRADSDNDRIKSEKDLSNRDGIEKVGKLIEKKVVNIKNTKTQK